MNRAILATFCAILAVNVTIAQTATSDSKGVDVLKVEAAFSEAKIHNDVAALDRILADDYIGINQWGVRRDKQATLHLFRTFTTTSLVPSRVSVRVSGDIAVIDGIVNESNQWKFLFLRTYVMRQGRWQLLSIVHTFAINPDTMTPIDPLLNQ
jgi:hypothetical protein